MDRPRRAWPRYQQPNPVMIRMWLQVVAGHTNPHVKDHERQRREQARLRYDDGDQEEDDLSNRQSWWFDAPERPST